MTPPPGAPLLPQNPDAEDAVLGAMLLSTKAIEETCNVLDGSEFFRETYATIFRAMRELHARGEPVDAITLVYELEERGELTDIGGREVVLALAALVPTASNVGHYARIVRDTARRRALVRAGFEITQLGMDGLGEPVELFDKAKAALRKANTTIRSSQDSRAIPFAQLPHSQTEFLLHDRIPRGHLSVLAGDPGLGKSTFACLLAAELSRGDLSGAPEATLLLSSEDSAGATVRPRLEAAGADLTLVHTYVGDQGSDAMLVIPEDVPHLHQLVVEIHAKLLILDPLTAHLSSVVNSWNDHSVRSALAPLQRLAEDTGCAVLVVLHLNKAQSADPIRRLGGSIAFTGAARSVLLFGKDPGDPDGERGRRRILAHSKSNLSPLAPSLVYRLEPWPSVAESRPTHQCARLILLGESELSDRDLLALGEGAPRGAVHQAIEFLKEELASGPRKARDLYETATDAGLSADTIKRAVQKLNVKKTKDGFQGPWIWELPTPPKGTIDNHSAERAPSCSLWQEPPAEPSDTGPSAKERISEKAAPFTRRPADSDDPLQQRAT